MYDTGGPVGVVVVVVVVEVVPYCTAAGDVSVEVDVVAVDVVPVAVVSVAVVAAAVVSVDVVAIVVEEEEEEPVGAVVVVAPEEVPGVVAGDVEEDEELLVAAGVVSVSVLIVSGDTSPSAPEASRPSAKSATRATGTLICNFRALRFMRAMPHSPCKTVRASLDRRRTKAGGCPRRSGQARTDQLSAVLRPLPAGVLVKSAFVCGRAFAHLNLACAGVSPRSPAGWTDQALGLTRPGGAPDPFPFHPNDWDRRSLAPALRGGAAGLRFG
jgi:hypothetical protein